ENEKKREYDSETRRFIEFVDNGAKQRNLEKQKSYEIERAKIVKQYADYRVQLTKETENKIGGISEEKAKTNAVKKSPVVKANDDQRKEIERIWNFSNAMFKEKFEDFTDFLNKETKKLEDARKKEEKD